jgi:hypothetical protein
MKLRQAETRTKVGIEEFKRFTRLVSLDRSYGHLSIRCTHWFRVRIQTIRWKGKS